MKLPSSRCKISLLTSACLIIFSPITFASGFQVFNGINYSNPAELPLLVKTTQIQLGDDVIMPTLIFDGFTRVPSPSPLPLLGGPITTRGKAVSTRPYHLPYGRFAQRVLPNVIFGLDVTEPFAINVVYPLSSEARYAGTQFTVKSLDIAPNVALQFNGMLENLTLGAGFDALSFFSVANQAYPSLPSFPPLRRFGTGRDVQFNNTNEGWGYGWHAGLVYRVLKGSLVGVSYWSSIKPKVTGPSTFTGFREKTSETEVPLPASTHIKLTQFFSNRWWASFLARYSQWSSLQTLTLTNTAGPISSVGSVFNWRDTWRFTLQSFYMATDKVTVGASASTDQSPAYGEFRGPMTPAGNALNLSVSSEYKITPQVGIVATYAHVFTADTNIHKTSYNGTLSYGQAQVYANLIGLRLKIDI